ncbi:MAG: putative sugar nucleotidyl transferase [Candidatus Caldarchaeum sp.]|uniref:Glucose-1-phosphate thymidylyltransferase n=1 Tax=Caldiarchaeum subterraneum TaxID=311458 RepID=A0A7C5Y8Y5_CALS0
MQVVVFEDEKTFDLWPLTATHPVYDLFLGTSTLLEKIVKHLPHDALVHLYTRGLLAKVVAEKNPKHLVNIIPEDGEILFVNGRLVADSSIMTVVLSLRAGQVLKSGNEVVAAKLKHSRIVPEFWSALAGCVPSSQLIALGDELKECKARLVSRLWDLVEFNRECIVSEASGQQVKSNVKGLVYAVGNIDVDEKVVLDGRPGPILIDSDVTIESFSKIVGPCYLGRGTKVFSGSVIAGSSFGPVCRVGGEVEDCVFQGYSNKRHYGFVGHSIIGEWVNMGAGTTVSNLKNTYGTVKVKLREARVDTGRVFLGSFFADHVKTSIGCMVSGGIKIGVASHVYREAVTDVPSFSIHALHEEVELELESAIRTAVRMMARRQVTPSTNYIEMLRKLFEETAAEREQAGVKRLRFSFYNA